MKTLVSHHYRACSDCTDVQAGTGINWWQRLITFGSSRTKVNNNHSLNTMYSKGIIINMNATYNNASLMKCFWYIPVTNKLFPTEKTSPSK